MVDDQRRTHVFRVFLGSSTCCGADWAHVLFQFNRWLA
jgi:hypothetical protein